MVDLNSFFFSSTNILDRDVKRSRALVYIPLAGENGRKKQHTGVYTNRVEHERLTLKQSDKGVRANTKHKKETTQFCCRRVAQPKHSVLRVRIDDIDSSRGRGNKIDQL